MANGRKILTAGIVLVTLIAGSTAILPSLNDSRTIGSTGGSVKALTEPYVIHLEQGWNLISIPFVGVVANNLPGLDKGDLIARWSSANQSFDKIFIKGVSMPYNDLVMNPWEGYWCFAAAPRTINITYGVVADPGVEVVRNVSVPIPGGWFFAGFAFNGSLRASDIPRAFAGGEILAVASFDPVAKKYETWLSAAPSLNNFAVVQRMGYLCYAKGSGVLSFFPG